MIFDLPTKILESNFEDDKLLLRHDTSASDKSREIVVTLFYHKATPTVWWTCSCTWSGPRPMGDSAPSVAQWCWNNQALLQKFFSGRKEMGNLWNLSVYNLGWIDLGPQMFAHLIPGGPLFERCDWDQAATEIHEQRACQRNDFHVPTARPGRRRSWTSNSISTKGEKGTAGVGFQTSWIELKIAQGCSVLSEVLVILSFFVIPSLLWKMRYASDTSGVGKCPFFGILNITFPYLLEIISPIVGWCSIGTFTSPCIFRYLHVSMVATGTRLPPRASSGCWRPSRFLQRDMNW